MTNNSSQSSRTNMTSHLMLFVTLVLVLSTFSSSYVDARAISRTKRSGYSDQRLAELETLVALSNMRGRVVTVPVAYGIIDPARIGKRKRSYEHSTESEEGGALLERLMRRFRSQLSDSQSELDEDVAQMISEA